MRKAGASLEFVDSEKRIERELQYTIPGLKS